MTLIYWIGAGFLVTSSLFFATAICWLAYEYTKMRIDESPGQVEKVKRDANRALLLRLSDELDDCCATSDFLNRLSHYSGISDFEMGKLVSEWRSGRKDLRSGKESAE